MANLEVFGGGGSANTAGFDANLPALARYTILKETTVRREQDSKSAKVSVLHPGETVEVIKIGGRNKAGRSRLKISDPKGWVSDRDKAGNPMMEQQTLTRGWSSGSIDMSAFESGGVGRASFKASHNTVDRMESVDDAKAWLQASVAEEAAGGAVAGATPQAAGAMSTFGQQPAPVASTFGQPPPASPQASAMSAFEQPAATGFGFIATAAAPEEDVPGRKEALDALTGLGLSDVAFGYLSGLLGASDPGAAFAASLAAGRNTQAL